MPWALPASWVVSAERLLEGYAMHDDDDKNLEKYYEKQVGALINGGVGDALAWIGRTEIHEAFHTLP